MNLSFACDVSKRRKNHAQNIQHMAWVATMMGMETPHYALGVLAIALAVFYAAWYESKRKISVMSNSS